MIKETNQRVMITLPKKQVEWMKKYAKKMRWTPSTLIKYLLVKRVNELYEMQQAKDDDGKLQEIIELARTQWLDD